MAGELNKASSFTIEELSTEDVRKNRVVRLIGRALPYRPITFSGTMRHDITWYPGNPEATIQVLGAAEDPTTINGRWSDRWLGSEEDLGLFNSAGLVFGSAP